jgi:hypothetical protein
MTPERTIPSMRTVALVACVGIVLFDAPRVVAAGNAPLRVSVPESVTARHAATLVVRAKRPQPETKLRVVLVAPRASVMDVVAALTQGGTAAGSSVDIPRDGFAVVARRFSTTSWKVRLAFPRAGLWRVVVPNWTLNGYTTPFPAIVSVRVR